MVHSDLSSETRKQIEKLIILQDWALETEDYDAAAEIEAKIERLSNPS